MEKLTREDQNCFFVVPGCNHPGGVNRLWTEAHWAFQLQFDLNQRPKVKVYVCKCPNLESSSHGLHAVPVPGVFVGDHANFHQERYENRLPEEEHLGLKPNLKSNKQFRWFLILTFLPKWDEHNQFDAEELPHRPDGSQLLSESSVQQHQTVHGKLNKRHKCMFNADQLSPTTDVTVQAEMDRAFGLRTCLCRVFTSCDMLLIMTR